MLVTVDITTGTTLDVGYPKRVNTGLTSIAGVLVVKVLDVATPAAIRYEAVAVALWSSSGGMLSVGYFTGLEVSTRYIITLEVLGA